MTNRQQELEQEWLTAETARRAAAGEFDPREDERQRAIARTAADQRAQRMAAMESRGIPLEHSEAIERGLRESEALYVARDFISKPRKAILVLSGPVGVGKTQAAAWCVSERGLFRRAEELSRIGRGRYNVDVMSKLEGCPVLVIDDLGAEHLDTKGFYLGMLDGIVDARYGGRLKTVLTTNLGWEKFQERYGGRISDRVGAFYECRGPSLRRAAEQLELDATTEERR